MEDLQKHSRSSTITLPIPYVSI